MSKPNMSLTGPSNDASEYLLYNVQNYKHDITDSFSAILAKLAGVLLDYMRFISDRLSMKNKPYYRFIFERGLSTLIHVFSVVFYYTKNLDLTYYHSQKAFYFYVEFIEQISDDNVTFLQLSSRDATTFVYKKTIYEINNEFKRNMAKPSHNDEVIFSFLELYTYIYRNIVNYIIQNKNFTFENRTNYILEHCNKISNLHPYLYNTKFKKAHIDCIYLLTNILVEREVSYEQFFSDFESFTKKLASKKKVDELQITNIMQKLLHCPEDINIVDWAFSEC